MPLDGSDREMLNTLHEIISKQMNHDKRLERLETLEFEKYQKSDGCIRWLDYDRTGGAATMRVDLPANPYELGDYGWTHYTMWYAITGAGAGVKTLHMQFNALAANYGYNYKWTRGTGVGLQQSVGADGQASIIIARLHGASYTCGWVQVPFFPIPIYMHTFGSWVCRDNTEEAGLQVEKGEFGGLISTAPQRITRIDLFASAGNIGGYVYLYGWCPTWDTATGPPD